MKRAFLRLLRLQMGLCNKILLDFYVAKRYNEHKSIRKELTS